MDSDTLIHAADANPANKRKESQNPVGFVTFTSSTKAARAA